jgi:DNA-nicking Smr family endonuclease
MKTSSIRSSKTMDHSNEGESADQAEEDQTLWSYVTRTVKPLRKECLIPGDRRFAGQRRKNLSAPERKISESTSGFSQTKSTGPMAADLDRRTEERLKRGQMPIEGVIDLHGLSAPQAQRVLERFLIRSYQQESRCVLVITGKGRSTETGIEMGVLKRSLPDWLSAPALNGIVLRHVQAKGKHGGGGAFYLLLRRHR